MESWCLAKYKSSLFIFMMIFTVGWIQSVYIEDERKALLEIKASLHELPYPVDVDNLLSTWVDHGSTSGGYCSWERIKCDTTSGYVIGLSLSNINMYPTQHSHSFNLVVFEVEPAKMIWPLNFSLFLHFKELKSLDLSWNCIGDKFVNTGLESLSALKKLEMLNLSNNCIETNIFPSLSGLVSLKILDLSYINGDQGYSPTHDISGFLAPENLEVLDLTGCGYYGILPIVGFKGVSILRKLKILNIGYNHFNESVLTTLSVLRSLSVLDLTGNQLSRLFPSQELSHLTKLEKLDLSFNKLDGIPSIQACKSLKRLERLESVSLGTNNFNTSIISCLSFLPSLKILDLRNTYGFGSSFPTQELSSLRELTTLDMSWCRLGSLTLNGTISNLLHLNLDGNVFSNDIMTSMAAFPSLRFLSLAECLLGGRLFADELPDLPHLEVLLLSLNDFNGSLPMEALASYHHLKVLDLSYNNFLGSIPSTIKSLSSLKVISLAGNKLAGSLPSHGFCELKNLHELDLSDNVLDGNLHECFNTLLSLKLFDISSNFFTGILLPSLIANLTCLEYVDFSDNSFEGSFPFSSFSNHTKLEVVKFISGNDKFEVETEEPKGWIPMFQLKVLVLSNCNINRAKGSVLPSFLLNEHELQVLDMSENSILGQFPNWLVKNNTMMKVLNLRNNLFGGAIMLFYTHHNIRILDISRNLLSDVIPRYIGMYFPNITHLDLSKNSLDGVIPSSIVDLSELQVLDLSHNKLSGEVPVGLFSSSMLSILKLSNNRLLGEVLSEKLSFGVQMLHLDNNCFTGKIGNVTSMNSLHLLDISNNFFTGLIPVWISNMGVSELVLRKNSFEGPFPCGNAPFLFLDISENFFSGPIPSCLNMEALKHLHLGSNRFTGSIPNSFRKLTEVLTLDVGNNYLSGKIPKFIGELSSLRILQLGKNNFSGSIPKQLCQLSSVSLLDLSNNFLSGLIPGCLGNMTGPSNKVFMQSSWTNDPGPSYYTYKSFINKEFYNRDGYIVYSRMQDEIMFTTKAYALTYKGDVLDIMSGLDLSCNTLTGNIPDELGLLIDIRVLNLSHNMLTGSIPLNLSKLINIESLDLSFNSLIGKVPSELIKLKFLAVLNVSYNNLSGRLPEMKAQFGTFTKESYIGNPLLCGPPLENKCRSESQVTHPVIEEVTDEKWYDMDMTSFYGSCGSTWFVFILAFTTLLYINPYWRRRWLHLVGESLYTCYYFLFDLVRKPTMLFYG